MSQLTSDKCNVAWFKLAEFVVRKEKERALVIYRLLVHSLPDDAMRCQLEGDLLHAFHDSKALQCYMKAAELYEKEGNFMQAIVTYDRCSELEPANTFFLEALIRLYFLLSNPTKAMHHFRSYIRLSVQKGMYEDIHQALDKAPLVYDQKISLLELVVTAYLEKPSHDFNRTIPDLTLIVDYYTQINDLTALSQFLNKLAALNAQADQHCRTYLLSQESR